MSDNLLNLLESMELEVAEWVEAKGWLDDRTFGDEIALLHSEASEALEAWRKHGFERWYALPNGAMTALEQGSTDYNGHKPEGVASEFADILIRLLDDCHRHGIDLVAEFKAKMAYNWTRTYRHGDKNL